jgi:hypothetical protein
MWTSVMPRSRFARTPATASSTVIVYPSLATWSSSRANEQNLHDATQTFVKFRWVFLL